MVNSGTEATMSALRLARGYTGRDKVIKFEGCYHGHVDSLLVAAGSGALTFGEPDSAGVPADFAALTMTLPFNDPDAVEKAFAAEGERIAAIIVEPYPANAGLVFPKDGYLELLRDLTVRNGALLIFDEVMTGFRVAKGGVQELTGVTPDLTAMGKVIGGGLPVGAYGGKRELMKNVSPDGKTYQAGTLSGNPLGMIAGLTTLKELVAHTDIYTNLEERTKRLKTRIDEFAAEHGLPIRIGQVGSMFTIFFSGKEIRCFDDAAKCDLEKFAQFFQEMLKRGVHLPPAQFEAWFLGAAHGEEEFEFLEKTCRESLSAVFGIQDAES